MELSSASCADCCSDCVPAAGVACCDAACCEASCQLLPPDAAISYEYHEPEENFVSIDDAKIKSLLLKIGQQQQELQRQQQQQKQRQQQQQEQLQIIELLDDDEAEIVEQSRSLKRVMRSSPDIQLIPKPMEPQRIVAQIELSDSEAEQEEEAETRGLPLTAVSCELSESTPIIVLQSDDDDQLLVEQRPTAKLANKKRPTRPYMKRRGRHFYQCQACGKKVQSNYNLRRHMMIHTGERPFPCDLCDRRFREFSDLKKHRRRHMHDPRYICMICRVCTPMEQDSTRCVECEGKNLLLNPQDFVEGAEKEEEREQEQEEGQEEETDQELEAEDDTEVPEVVLSPPVAPPPAPSPPILVVTLVPPLVTPPQPVPPPLVIPAPPSRPPMPRSCSSANSSSSLSNDAVPRLKAKPNRNRRSYPCPLCHRPFGTRHNLKRHYMIHTGEKPFSCSKCRKPFRECSTLKKHMVTHVRDRWYKCLRCPAKFQDYLHYSEHKDSHGSELPLETDSSSVQRLLSSESEDGDSSLEDWLECCECQRRFTQLDAYTAHLKQHDLELYGMSVDDVDDEDQEMEVDVA